MERRWTLVRKPTAGLLPAPGICRGVRSRSIKGVRWSAAFLDPGQTPWCSGAVPGGLVPAG